MLTLIAQTGTGGGQGYVVEYRGAAIEALSMEARMTVCNMSIEWGAKAGLIAPDETTFAYLQGPARGPDRVPTGTRPSSTGRTLVTDDDAVFDAEIDLDASTHDAVRHLGHQPRPGRAAGRLGARSRTTSPRRATGSAPARRWSTWASRPVRRCARSRSTPSSSGSCTNGRIEDLRAAADVIKGRQVADGTRLLVVPGSVRVRLQAEDEGLDVIFKEAGAEWRGAGCSMCLGMNPDQLAPQERSASTSNRNFEGRQGKGGRTHLVSVPVAAATAIRGDPQLARRPATDQEA